MASSRHNADKENIHRTRIPLPKDPLPALPKHLLVDKRLVHKPEIPNRQPLKPINAQSTSTPQAGPSKKVQHKTKHRLNINAKHVTMRQRGEDLDWHYTVFSDKDKNATFLCDDEKYLDDKCSYRYFVKDIQQNALGAVSNAVTPNLKASLEPNRARNIKRSLKRPHSQELQGLSPHVVATQEKPDDKAKRHLNFNDSIQDIFSTPEVLNRSFIRSYNHDYSTDVFAYLLANEIKPLHLPRTSNITRACVINWLMKVNGADGNPAIIQAACWYFDSILGLYHVELEKLQLVAAVCFWIAQKLNGPVLAAKRLVRLSGSAFTIDDLLVAERAVMTKLKFPRQPIVAQDYITYLCWWCDAQNAGEIEMAATFLAMCGLLVDRSVCDEYPSVIAVAAVRNALLLLRKKELMPRLQICNIFVVAEKKATNMSYTCSILRRAVRTVAASLNEYKAPLEHYGMPPRCIAQRIVLAANELSVMDARNTEGR